MMTDENNQHTNDDEIESVSKTRIKKEMIALQKLGESLTELNAEQRAKIPMDDALRRAVEEAPKITQNSGRKRHMQFIGKLMRSADAEAIQEAYDKIQEGGARLTRQHHQIEKWRDALLEADNQQAVEAFFTQYPDCNRQQINQLIRAANKEAQDNKPPASARKLFKFIRDTLAQQL